MYSIYIPIAIVQESPIDRVPHPKVSRLEEALRNPPDMRPYPESVVTKMNQKVSNTELGDILELLALKALAKITSRKLGPGTRPAKVAPHRAVIEWNLPNPHADRYGTPFTNCRLIWHQANRQQGGSGS